MFGNLFLGYHLDYFYILSGIYYEQTNPSELRALPPLCSVEKTGGHWESLGRAEGCSEEIVGGRPGCSIIAHGSLTDRTFLYLVVAGPGLPRHY